VLETVLLRPFENFLFALNSKESKRQYPNILDKFLTFIGFEGTIQEKCDKFSELSGKDSLLLQSHVIRFINLQKDRIKKMRS
jgi:hypothetical protein